MKKLNLIFLGLLAAALCFSGCADKAPLSSEAGLSEAELSKENLVTTESPQQGEIAHLIAGKSSAISAQCTQTVGILGGYFATQMTAFLQNNGHTVVTVDQTFINAGGLNTLDVLYFNRGGTSVGNANIAAIEAFVKGGGIIITEFQATVDVMNNFNFCKAGNLDISFGVPSGTVCGGNTITITSPSNPIATSLPASWSCSGDPIGVWKVFSNLDPNFDVVATVNVDQNNDGLNDPVVATCCVEDGIWVAFFTDFGDWQSLQNPRTCPFPPCNRSVEDEALMLNAVCLALGACEVKVDLDIKPTSCPNPLNTKNKGVLPVAVLGTANLDVNDIDVSTVQLEGVSPLRSDIEDVAAPVSNRQDDCDCTTDGPDGFDDLTLKFDTQDIVAALGAVNDGQEVKLTLTGNLNDGTPITGLDCVVIKKKGK